MSILRISQCQRLFSRLIYQICIDDKLVYKVLFHIDDALFRLVDVDNGKLAECKIPVNKKFFLLGNKEYHLADIILNDVEFDSLSLKKRGFDVMCYQAGKNIGEYKIGRSLISSPQLGILSSKITNGKLEAKLSTESDCDILFTACILSYILRGDSSNY